MITRFYKGEVMSEKYLEFMYHEKPRRVYQLPGKAGFIEGIDTNLLSEDEKKAFDLLVEDYHKKLEPFITKAYRRFDPAKMS